MGKPSVLFLIRARYQLLLRRHSLGAGRHPPLDAAVQLYVWSVRRSRPSARSFSDVALNAEPGAEGLELRTLGSTTAKKSTRPLWRVGGRGKAYARGGEAETGAGAGKASAFAGGREPSTFRRQSPAARRKGRARRSRGVKVAAALSAAAAAVSEGSERRVSVRRWARTTSR